MPIAGVDWRRVDATIEDVVDTDYDGSIDDFYLRSWLLTHYLTIDGFDKPERRRNTDDYLRRYDAGEDPLDAFAASFGVSALALQAEIDAYGLQERLNVLNVPRLPYEGEISRRVMEGGEELYLLGDLAVELYASDAALDFFTAFDRKYADSPVRFKVHSRQAVAFVHKDDLRKGDALVEELVALNLDDGDVHADLAHYFHDRFEIQGRRKGVDARANLERSIRHGKLAVERNPRDLEALFYLGQAYGFNGDVAMAVDTLQRAFEQAPGAEVIALSLARVLYQSGSVDDAALLISRILSATHSDEARKLYGELLQQMKDGNVDPSFLDPYSTAD
jgi:tetratricopeptide (TPR) repeat protein